MLEQVPALLQDALTYCSTLAGAGASSIADPTERATEILRDAGSYVSRVVGGGGFSIAEERDIVYRRMGRGENRGGMRGALEGMVAERDRRREVVVRRGLEEEEEEGVWEWIRGMVAALWSWICMMLKG